MRQLEQPPPGRVVKDANVESLYIVCHLTAVGPSLAQFTCETSQVLLRVVKVCFLGDLPFLPHLTIDSAQNEWNNLDRPQKKINKKK